MDFVLSFEEALGKVRPAPDDAAPADLEELLGSSRIGIEEGIDEVTVLRLARVYADGLRRIAETEVDAWHRFIEMPRLEAGLSHSAL